MYNIEAPKEKRVTGVGFGGVMLEKEKSETWMASAVTVEESDVLVVPAKIFKEIFLKDHRNKYILAKRTKELSTMPVFKLLMPSHLQKMSEDFRNNSYSSKSTIVDVGDALTKIIVVASGEVDVTASVEDPRAPGRILDVSVARLGKGGVIGDVELVYSKSIFTLKAKTATAKVETFEISRENFGNHIFENNHADAAKEKLLTSVEEKVAFNLKRVKEEMLKFAHFTRRAEEEWAKARGFKGGIAEKVSEPGQG
jgi:CRP-like cAMP-binding protein